MLPVETPMGIGRNWPVGSTLGGLRFIGAFQCLDLAGDNRMDRDALKLLRHATDAGFQQDNHRMVSLVIEPNADADDVLVGHEFLGMAGLDLLDSLEGVLAVALSREYSR